MSRSITLANGKTIAFPAYVPVTTFGSSYPLDNLIRPFLPRLAQAAMISMHYARQMTPGDRLSLPLWVDSGGFALLATDASLVEIPGSRGTVLGAMDVREQDGDVKRVTPRDVLEFQMKVADVGFTLDFPIPPGTDPIESQRRLDLTIANARWAADNCRGDFALYGCVQGWDEDSYRNCAAVLVELPFAGLAIGGLVPRVRNWDFVKKVVQQTREITEKPIHVFGIGKPELVRELFAMGVDSVDSSSYVQMAAQGKVWGESGVSDPAVTDQVALALKNLAVACRSTLPLSCYDFFGKG